jgi:quinol monooxygenase YgiN
MSIDTVSLTAALVVKLVAKPDEADEVRTFLADAVRLANQEQGTIAWFALRTDTTTFWIVDAFPTDAERQEHLEGAIASSLLANAERLLDRPPEILRPRSLPPSCPSEQRQPWVRDAGCSVRTR